MSRGVAAEGGCVGVDGIVTPAGGRRGCPGRMARGIAAGVAAWMSMASSRGQAGAEAARADGAKGAMIERKRWLGARGVDGIDIHARSPGDPGRADRSRPLKTAR
jgi:hypothetical protein